MSDRNAFQAAVLKLNCLINRYVDQPGDGPSAAEQLKALGGERHVRFLKGWSTKQKGSTGAPSKDCQEGDENSQLQLHVGGFGHVEGTNLADAVAQMEARISGGEPVASGKKKK